MTAADWIFWGLVLIGLVTAAVSAYRQAKAREALAQSRGPTWCGWCGAVPSSGDMWRWSAQERSYQCSSCTHRGRYAA